ncbi:MAG TPA: SDR family NAD(P)-dependent oxidoreductase [Micropepsaceae bacterium]|nr:SDR family NAD(P)-dependent oxidoreductase [Micropepsaceae bacterium]
MVTGAARNIGRAIALELAKGGAAVAVATRSDVKAAETVVEETARAGGKAFALAADVAREEQVKHMVEETFARYGRLKILHMAKLKLLA